MTKLCQQSRLYVKSVSDVGLLFEHYLHRWEKCEKKMLDSKFMEKFWFCSN